MLLSVADDVGRRMTTTVPFIGREEELELLHNTFARAVRDRRVHLVTLYGDAGRRQVPPRARVHRRGRALDDPDGAVAAVRRGRHVLADRRDGQGRGRDHRRRLDGRGGREAAQLLRRRGGRGPARARVGRARRGRRRADSGRDRVGGADVGDRARRPAAARARLLGHPLGRGADARPDRAPRERRARRAAPDPLPRAPRAAGRAPGLGRRQGARDLDRARAASARRGRTSSSTRSPRAKPSSSRRSSARPCSTRRTGTRSSSRRRCGCSSSPAASRRGSRRPCRR